MTHDHHPFGDHPAQARALCAAGARHIQLRTKDAPPDRWLALAREVTAICHAHDALCIINDNPEIARDSGADGVHLGTQDAPWSDARRLLGPRTLIGGTVNNADHARAAATAHAAGDLDYIGIGPLRHTTTKQKLAPVLGLEGIRDLFALLPPALPSFVIGGVLPADLPAIRALDAAGAAVSGALLNAPDLPARHHEFLTAWSSRP
ncbi:thiamine-phosphate pyrophosphorylase [Opitutaceae bacterium TAV5]|nr:thiamine-phosphate pyrophosphorylase [Opitutaceae bacterium TAV5]